MYTYFIVEYLFYTSCRGLYDHHLINEKIMGSISAKKSFLATTQCIENSAKCGERSVLILRYFSIPCFVEKNSDFWRSRVIPAIISLEREVGLK